MLIPMWLSCPEDTDIIRKKHSGIGYSDGTKGGSLLDDVAVLVKDIESAA